MTHVQRILDKTVACLKDVPGILGIVLGGSRARGTESPDSDIDVGLYYDEHELDMVALNVAARLLDDDGRENLVVSPGGWGNWVNAGGWLSVDGHHVDLILRDIRRVESTIADCIEGIVTSHYQTGHPHAYINVMYMGELAVCKVLWSSSEEIIKLKALAETYPKKLKHALINFFSFEAGFSHMFAAQNSDKDDAYYLAAHIVRSISALNQVIFAINEQYCLNEKKAVKMIESFSIKPMNYKNRVDDVFSRIASDPSKVCESLKSIIDETEILRRNS